jgi:hypothetical protein
MVDIAPFRGLLFNQEKIGSLDRVIAPPYDVISPNSFLDWLSINLSRERCLFIFMFMVGMPHRSKYVLFAKKFWL